MPPIRKNTTIFFTTGRYLAWSSLHSPLHRYGWDCLLGQWRKAFLILGGQDATGDQAGTYLYLLVLRPRVAYLAFHVAIQYQYRRYHCPRLRIDRERERHMGRFRDHVGYLY